MIHDSRLLDVGCGVLRGGMRLIDYLAPNCYYGVDFRQEAIIKGFKLINFFNLSSKKPSFLALMILENHLMVNLILFGHFRFFIILQMI